jgi:hypothetical protein
MNEWSGLLAYTPDNPNMFFLNSTTWAILELSEGRTSSDLEDAFADFTKEVVNPDQARATLAEGLQLLEEKNILEFVPEDAASIERVSESAG